MQDAHLSSPRDATQRFQIQAQLEQALQKAVEQYEAICKDPLAEQEKLLRRIVEVNKETEYGRRYGLHEVESLRDFQERFPITTYADYEPLIEEILSGKENVLFPGKPEVIQRTSGTTGKGKSLPLIAEDLKLRMEVTQVGLATVTSRLKSRTRRGVFLVTCAGIHQHPVLGVPVGAIGGLAVLNPALKPLFEASYVAPFGTYRISPQPAANYVHALFALQEPDLAVLGAPFNVGVLEFLRVISSNWSQLVSDIEEGRLGGPYHYSPEHRAEIEPLLLPNPTRAAEIRKIFETSSPDWGSKVWPDLEMINAISTGSFSHYKPQIQSFFSPDHALVHHSPLLGGSEAMIGFPLEPGSESFVLAPHATLIEFLPVEDGSAAQAPTTALTLGELEVGRDYELVVSVLSGLYRYRTGDVVRVVGAHKNTPTPKVEFRYRVGTLLNLAGEKITEAQAQAAAQALARLLRQSSYDFSFWADRAHTPPRYVCLLEVEDYDSARFPQGLLDVEMDNLLCAENSFYATMRKREWIGQATVVILRAGAMDLVRRKLIERGGSPAQVKCPRLLPDEELLSLMMSHRYTESRC